MGDKCSQADRNRWNTELRAEKERKAAVDAEGGFVCPDCGSNKYHDHFGPQEYMEYPNRHVYLPRKISHSTCAKCGRYVFKPLDFSAKKKRIHVFVWKKNPGQVGCGDYHMTACFINFGVHVPFVILSHSENDYISKVEAAVPCDGLCRRVQGQMEDFSEERQARNASNYARKPIVDAALAFRK